MISGTIILVSGLLSSMRVIRSFRSSATSGLGTGDTSGWEINTMTKGSEREVADRCYSLIWEFQGLTLDLTV